ncbi:MAG: hypothetical protein KF805_02975 [Phycisphaeraceae bacterium]|nr:hypothetical protein [Phycisphaeraceae bacterium]
MSTRSASWPSCYALIVAGFAIVAPCPAAAPDAAAAPEQTVSAGPLQATLKLDRASLNVAENLVATLWVKAPTGVQVALPLTEAKLGGFTVISVVDEPLRTVPTGTGEQQELMRRYTLEPFLPGEYTLPPLEIRWKKGGNESGVARTAEVKVPVTSLLPKQAGSDAKAPDTGTIRGEYTVAKPRDAGALWTGVGIGFGAAAAVGCGLWVRSRRRHATDAIDRLLQRVEDLRRADRGDTTNPHALHELAGAIRGAIADRVEPGAASAEASELVKTLERHSGWGATDARRVGEVLGALDAARFSGACVPATEFRRYVETVVEVLKKLRAMPTPVGGSR